MGTRRKKRPFLVSRKKMQEMEERLRLQDEEMEEANRKATEGKKLVENIAENLQQEFLIREAAHADEMDRARRDFEMERAELERQLKTMTESRDEMAATAVDVAGTM